MALFQLVLSCGCAHTSQPAPGKALPALRPTDAQPTPSANFPTHGDAEDELLTRLRASFQLHYQTIRQGKIVCDVERFTPIRDTGADFKRGSGFFADSRVIGGSMGSSFAGESLALHGYSDSSLLIDGSEWFYSREACLAGRGRYPPVDAASEAQGLDIAALIDRFQDSSVWFLGSRRVEVSGRRDAWYVFGDAVYNVRFYKSAPFAWLRGPVNRPAVSASEARHGLYRASAGASSFDVGAERFCAAADACPAPAGAARQPVVPGTSLAGLVDFAEQFWSYGAPLFVPIRDTGGTTCQRLDPRPGEPLHFQAFGKSHEYRLTRAVGGFYVWRHVEGGTWSWAPMAVHGRDQRRFLVNGSPWYYRLDDCLAGKDSVKPVNFRVPGVVTLTDTIGNTGRLQLETKYFALRTEATGVACRAVKFEPRLAGGRLTIESSSGPEERDYDFYTDEWAFWLGPILRPDVRGAARYQGQMIVPLGMSGGIVMNGERWYASSEACLVARGQVLTPTKSH